MSVTERCPKCGAESASPPAEVYCVECATEGWEQDAIAHLRVAVESLQQQLRGAVSALESAYDAMVHRPVDSELFRAAIRDVAAALGRDEDYDDPPAGQ